MRQGNRQDGQVRLVVGRFVLHQKRIKRFLRKLAICSSSGRFSFSSKKKEIIQEIENIQSC